MTTDEKLDVVLGTLARLEAQMSLVMEWTEPEGWKEEYRFSESYKTFRERMGHALWVQQTARAEAAEALRAYQQRSAIPPEQTS